MKFAAYTGFKPAFFKLLKFNFYLLFALIGASVGVAAEAMWAPTPLYAATCAGTGIMGTVFRDYNANGVQDALEPGIGGMVVTAYDANGGSASCETPTTGQYGINPAGAYPVRLEFTLPASGELDFLHPGATNGAAQTSVIFVDAATSGLAVGFNNPGQYCGASPSPTIATSCFVFGEQNDNAAGVNKDMDVLVSFPYTAGSTDLTNDAAMRTPSPTHIAAAKELGSVWGLAWDPQSERLYAAAFMKRHAGFGPNGPGAIYRITTAGASLFYDFGTAAGADPHPQPTDSCLSPQDNTTSNFNCWLYDTNAFDAVGGVAFGDLDIADNFKTLYTVNLNTKALLAIPIDNPANTVATALPTPTNCPATDVRPFGIGINDGKVYVGAVCSGESTQDISQLRGYVYAFANGSFATTPVLEFSFGYDRGDNNLQWAYWLNSTTFDPNNPNDTRQLDGKWAQPWITDIVFDRGDMILGIRDRNGDLFGVVAGGPDPNDSNRYTAISRGDILRACANGSGSWTLESNGACGGVITGGAGDGQGPGGGEYYFNDEQFSHPHRETSVGSLVQIAGLPDVVTTAYSPIEIATAGSDGGIKWFNNSTAATSRGYVVYDGSGEVALFDKANGLGDLEAYCPAAPLEIGNRVWQDTNGNGVQDPTEPGLDDVTVQLYNDGVLIGTTVTANGGQYIFDNSNVTQNGATGIRPVTFCNAGDPSAYEIYIPNATGAQQQAALANLTLTTVDSDATTNGDLRDSDGTAAGTDVIYTIPCADIQGAGWNNHTYDFGFAPPIVQAEPVAIGNFVFLDANNNGRFDTGDSGLDGVAMQLLVAGQSTPISTTTTASGGFYQFDTLQPGDYQVCVAAGNFGAGQVLAGYTSSTGAGTDETTDQSGDENGIDNASPAASGICSNFFSLQPNSEVTGEDQSSYTGTLDDDNVNFTDDFGFVAPAPVELVAIGNVVFTDFNNNGSFDATDTGLDGVTVALLPAGADPLSATPISTVTTQGGGFYLFDNLQPGQYFVYVQAANFQTNGVLRNFYSSTGNGTATTIDDNIDENGIDDNSPATNGIRSIVYDLQPNMQPTAEAGAGAYPGALDDDNVNFTADFGFYKPLTLGNRVWLDDGAGGGGANNGVRDGSEAGIANVVVSLLDGAGNPVLSGSGAPMTTTTNSEGYYLFTNLLPGNYIVRIDAVNFAASGPLAGLSSSTPTEADPNSDVDTNDNGINNASPAANGIQSGVVTLNYDNEPTNEADLGPVGAGEDSATNNLTVDFGFVAPTALDEEDEPQQSKLFLPYLVQ
ncbi:MAG: SdrD B-like domain-containing protein [Caldilineaceae bacterium]